MTPSCAWRRISRSAIRWSTGRAISAISTAITPPPCATPRRGSPRSRGCCSRASTRTRSISARPTTRRDEEPVVLPAAFPNLLANGSQGIAVGMATSIPPHNAAELCDAALHLIKQPERHVRAADAIRARARTCRPAASSSRRRPRSPRPTAPDAARSACGRGGRRRIRARGTWNIVVTEIPYLGAEVPPDREDRRAAAGARSCRFSPTCATNWRRMSASCSSRARATVDPIILMESLFRLTELESRIPMNVNVLAGGKVPKVLEPRRMPARMARPPPRGAGAPLAASGSAPIDKRLEILGGLLIVYLDLDRVIKIIREEDEPKAELMRVFKLTEIQANAILDTRLRSLAQARGDGAQARAEEPAGGEGQIEELLGSDKLQWKTVAWRDPRGAQEPSARTRRSASAAPSSPTRRRPPTSTSPRRWSSASRSRSSSRRRAGSAR